MNWAALLAGIVTGAVAGSLVGWLVSKLIVRRERRRRTARTVAALQGSRPPVANLTPDSLVSVDVGGKLYTDYVKNVLPGPARQQLSRWQRFMRRLTPKRFRKPLVTRPADPLQRALALNADLKRAVDGLTK